jgi:hypothetical protein
MRRRDFIAGLVFAAATGRAHAQSTGKVYRIAFAHPTVPVADQNQASKGSLFEDLTRLGYVEGRNLLIERYSGEGRAAHDPDLARSSGRRALSQAAYLRRARGPANTGQAAGTAGRPQSGERSHPRTRQPAGHSVGSWASA